MPAIPPVLEPEIILRTAEGATSRDLSAWLLEAHGITASYKAVQRLLTRTRSERAEVAKAVVREKLTKTVTTDIDALEFEKRRLRKLATRLYKGAMTPLPPGLEVAERISLQGSLAATGELYLKAVDRLAKVIDTKLHYSGADAPDDSVTELAGAESRLTSKLARLAAGEAASAPREPEPSGEGGS